MSENINSPEPEENPNPGNPEGEFQDSLFDPETFDTPTTPDALIDPEVDETEQPPEVEESTAAVAGLRGVFSRKTPEEKAARDLEKAREDVAKHAGVESKMDRKDDLYEGSKQDHQYLNPESENDEPAIKPERLTLAEKALLLRAERKATKATRKAIRKANIEKTYKPPVHYSAEELEAASEMSLEELTASFAGGAGGEAAQGQTTIPVEEGAGPGPEVTATEEGAWSRMVDGVVEGEEGQLVHDWMEKGKKTPSVRQGVINSAEKGASRIVEKEGDEDIGSKPGFWKTIGHNTVRAVLGHNTNGEGQISKRLKKLAVVADFVFNPRSRTANETRQAINDVSARPMDMGSKSLKYHNRKARKSEERYDNTVEQPFLSRWREFRRSRAQKKRQEAQDFIDRNSGEPA